MRFMVPHGWLRRAWRNVLLRLSPRLPWARRRVNSGRLAQPWAYPASAFVGPAVAGLPAPGSVVVDAPVGEGRARLRALTGGGFVALCFGEAPAVAGCEVLVVGRDLDDPTGRLRATYAPDGASRTWLIRPDGHIAAVGLPSELPAMLGRALGRG